VIDNSSFAQTGPATYRLNVELKNRRFAAVAMPALELTLTSLQNDVLVRKVLLPAELGASSDRLEQATPFAGVFTLLLSPPAVSMAALSAASPASSAEAADPAPTALPITGYRLFAFYP
jgi:hypothetical protein